MENLNFYILPIAALVPLILGMIWYHPKVLGTRLSNITGESLSQISQPKSIGTIALLYLCSLLLSYILMLYSVHQSAIFQMFFMEPSLADPNSEFSVYTADFMAKYGNRHRTFFHGVIHGSEAGLLYGLGFIGIPALLTGKSLKSIWVHVAFLIVTCSLVAGLICAFL